LHNLSRSVGFSLLIASPVGKKLALYLLGGEVSERSV